MSLCLASLLLLSAYLVAGAGYTIRALFHSAFDESSDLVTNLSGVGPRSACIAAWVVALASVMFWPIVLMAAAYQDSVDYDDEDEMVRVEQPT